MAEPDKKANLKLLQALNVVWDVILIIAVPTILLALGGRWLDRHFNSSPWFTLFGLVIALAIVYVLVSRKAKDIAKDLGGKTT